MVERNRIFAHRGLWLRSKLQGNSRFALKSALKAGFSIETDVRDFMGGVSISHDPVSTLASPMPLLELLNSEPGNSRPPSRIAINVKADGLLNLLDKDALREQLNSSQSYFFDMSVPETLRYSSAAMPFAIRHSEYEPISRLGNIRWPNPPSAFWIDGFHRDWFLDDQGQQILRLAEIGTVTIVSSELHGRDHRGFKDWFLGNMEGHPNLTVCTDYPEEFSGNE